MRRRLWMFALLTFAWAITMGWVIGKTHPEAFGEAPTGATVYEDGSWVSQDGHTTGCLEGAVCND